MLLKAWPVFFFSLFEISGLTLSTLARRRQRLGFLFVNATGTFHFFKISSLCHLPTGYRYTNKKSIITYFTENITLNKVRVVSDFCKATTFSYITWKNLGRRNHEKDRSIDLVTREVGTTARKNKTKTNTVELGTGTW